MADGPDNCRVIANADQVDLDADGTGDACDQLVPIDAGLPDAGADGLPDAGSDDAGLPDGGTDDAGLPDAGTDAAGPPDAGAVDASSADAAEDPAAPDGCSCRTDGSPAAALGPTLALLLALRSRRRGARVSRR